MCVDVESLCTSRSIDIQDIRKLTTRSNESHPLSPKGREQHRTVKFVLSKKGQAEEINLFHL